MKNNNKSQFFSTREETNKWLKSHDVKNYTINDDLSVDVNRGVDISHQNLELIPIKFKKVTGGFWCDCNKITSLAGSPETVGGNFDCGNNQLTGLVGSPKTVGNDFWCVDNKLTNFEGAPKFIGGSFNGYENRLISLFEISDCNFKNEIIFNIDKKSFKQKELIEILEKYYDRNSNFYVLSGDEFSKIIKPILEKNHLQNKLNLTNNYLKVKNNFI